MSSSPHASTLAAGGEPDSTSYQLQYSGEQAKCLAWEAE